MSDEPTSAEANPDTTDELGFASLATRLAGWGTRLILCGLIVLVGVTFGRQVLIWWGHRDVNSVGTKGKQAQGADLGQPFIPQFVQFGNSPIVVQSERLQGKRDDALKRLSAAAKQLLHSSQPLQKSLGPKEKKLLAWITKKKPVADLPTGKLYQSIGPLPMVVAVKPNEEKTIASQFRVVSWGIGLPANSEESQWTLYTYSAHRQRLPVGGKTLPDLPRPEGSRKILTLQSPSGSSMVVMAGPGRRADWKEQIQRHFEERQWKVVEDWRETGNIALIQFSGAKKSRVVIQLAKDNNNEIQAVFTTLNEE